MQLIFQVSPLHRRTPGASRRGRVPHFRGWASQVALALLVCAAQPSAAGAYSAFDDYMRSIEEGGGGGKLFTGTPADGYTCDVCHRGGEPAALSVVGLPEAGYVPGATYEISLSAPATVPRVAIMAELTDLRGAPAGTTALLPFAMWLPSELCEGGEFPASDVCRTGDEPGCCLDVKPGTDACSFPGERSVLWMGECGAHSSRMLWTAPTQPGDVWFSASLLTSNAGNNVDGDGVTLYRRRLHVTGSSEVRTEATGSCQVQSLPKRPLASLWLFLLACISWPMRRRWRLTRS